MYSLTIIRRSFFVGSSGSPDTQHDDQTLFPLFNNLVSNETDNDMVAEFQTSLYILPKDSCFYMVHYIPSLTQFTCSFLVIIIIHAA